MDDFGFVIMKIIINNDTIRMAEGGQERSGWRGGCIGHLSLQKAKVDKRHPVSPGENSVRSTNPSRGKDVPSTGIKDWFVCLFRIWVVETGSRQGVGDGVRVAVEI
jgi:hypothetical protein